MKFGYVFPGQGSQEIGMLADAEAEVKDLVSEASDALGYDLWQLIQEGPEDKLNQTEFTQPALLTASYAFFKLAQEAGAPAPDIVAGHSLGEYSALVAAEVLAFADAVKLVQQRGQFMQSAVPVGQGGMAAVMGLDDDAVRSICDDVSGETVVQAVNFNAPGQVVIAGANEALNAAIDACKEAGAKRAIALAVSAPFHSSTMQPAAEKMREALSVVTFNAPSVPVMQNVDASIHQDPDAIRENLVTQMYSAVLWTDTIQNIAAGGVDTLIECGPGKVLTGLARRIDKSLSGHNVNSLDAAKALNGSLS